MKKVIFILSAALMLAGCRPPSGCKKAESTIITVLPTSDGTSYVVTSGLAVGDVIVAI